MYIDVTKPMFVGIIYTDNINTNDIITIYAKDRIEAEDILKQYMDKMYSYIDSIRITGKDLYMPTANDATVMTKELVEFIN